MNYLLVLLIIMLFLLFYYSLEYIKNRVDVETIITRKIAHVVSGLAVVFFSEYLNRVEFLLSTFIFILIFSVAYRKKVFTSIHLNHNIGEILYPISLFFLGLFLYEQKELFVSGVLLLALADTASAVAGKKFSQEPNYYFGAFGFWVTAFFLLFFIDPVLLRVGYAAVLSLVEYKTIKGWDNLTVPIAYIMLVSLL